MIVFLDVKYTIDCTLSLRTTHRLLQLDRHKRLTEQKEYFRRKIILTQTERKTIRD